LVQKCEVLVSLQTVCHVVIPEKARDGLIGSRGTKADA